MNTTGGAQKRNEDSPLLSQRFNAVNRETLAQLTKAIARLDRLDLQVSFTDGALTVTHPDIPYSYVHEGHMDALSARAVAWLLNSMADGYADFQVEDALWGDL